MAVTVLIPTTLRSFTTNKSELTLNGSTVEEILNELVSEYEDVRKAIFDNDKKLRSFVNVFVDGQNIKELDGFKTKVRDGAEIMLIPAIAGGSVTDSIINDEDNKEKLSNDEINRYSRHLLLKEIGLKGQRKLKAARVLIVGVGVNI